MTFLNKCYFDLKVLVLELFNGSTEELRNVR